MVTLLRGFFPLGNWLSFNEFHRFSFNPSRGGGVLYQFKVKYYGADSVDNKILSVKSIYGDKIYLI
jgi:hypothetical protein